jgi:4-diphosphocytidyl-2-C-methyl-D-erythritol kinase
MVLFPPCKINLGLRVLGRRKDGYHDLETVFWPLAICDVLEIVRSETLALSASGLPIAGDPGANLCLRAYALVKKDFPDLPPVHMYLHKQIPMGAGLGGGSSDGASLLKALNEEFRLGLDREKLAGYALQLGSDCPFFVQEAPCVARGRGEELEPIALDLSGYTFVIVYPGLAISTAEAFAALGNGDAGGARGAVGVAEIVAGPVESWKDGLRNDFEAWACGKYPELQGIKDRLYEAGALYASMTGSGSAFYGIFRKKDKDSLRPIFGEHANALFPGYFFRIL